MIVAQLVRTGNFETPLSPVSPFVFAACVGLRTLKSVWGTSCDDIFDGAQAINVKQIARDYLTKYLKQATEQDVMAQEGSWHFDRAAGVVLVHAEHSRNPLTTIFDHGHSFGVSQDELVYIDDYEYLPLIKGAPELDRETDYTNSDQPTGSTGTLTLTNLCYVNEEGTSVGMLDFLLTEPIWGNDVFVFDYDGETLTPLTFKYIQDISIGEEDVEIELQDRRFS